MYKATIAARLKLVKMCVLAVLLLGVGSAVFSQVLWQGTTKGMTVEQVKELFPKATKPTPPYSHPTDKTIDIPLELKKQTIAGELLDVSFIFKNKVLDNVSLGNSNPIPGTGEVMFNSINTALRAKYGAPLKTNQNSDMITEVVWLSGETDITLIWVVPSRAGLSMPSKISIIYNATLAKDAGAGL